MITIFNEDNSHESRAALEIESLFLKEWPFLKKDKKSWVNIYVEPFLNSGNVKSSDLVIFGGFENPQEITKNSNQKILIKNFCFTLEVKNHARDNLKFESGHLKVFYYSNQKYGNASKQADSQWWALQSHIRSHARDPVLFGGYGIYLRNLSESDIPKDQSNQRSIQKLLLSGDKITNLLGEIFLEMYRLNKVAKKETDGNSIILSSFKKNNENYFKGGSFFPSFEPTSLDEERMLQIATGNYRDDWLNSIGNKLFVFKGHGGTGKTVRLLQTARKLITEKNSNCLFLTFNIPLRSNLVRLARLMGIHLSKREDDGGGILFEGVMRFCSAVIMYANEINNLEIEIDNETFLTSLFDIHKKSGKTNYEYALDEFGKYLENGTLTKNELGEIAKEAYSLKSGHEDFEYGFIDECQDWRPLERDIVMAYFGEEKIICAHGLAQETRGKTLSWTKSVPEDKKKEARLVKAVRMKKNLASFVKDFSKKAFKENSYEDMEITEDGLGGNIHIIEGDYKKFFKFSDEGGLEKEDFTLKSLIEDNMQPIDYLFCVPDSIEKMTVTNKEGFKHDFCNLAFELYRNKIPVWDATSNKRDKMPVNDEFRIVNYSTCRGLEGWAVFNFNLDTAFVDFIKKYKIEKRRQEKIIENEKSQKEMFDFPEEDFENLEDEAENYAAKMILIALTRGVSKVLIHINSRNSKLGRILKELHERKDYEGVISWDTL